MHIDLLSLVIGFVAGLFARLVFLVVFDTEGGGE